MTTTAKRKRKRAATQEERNALRVKAIHEQFRWTNEEWADTFLPWLRSAIAVNSLEDEELKDFISSGIKDGAAAHFLEGWSHLKLELDQHSANLTAALSRSFLILERLGYSPENLPPELPVH